MLWMMVLTCWCKLDSLVEEIAKAQYDEDCSMARLDLIAKMAMIVRSTMDEVYIYNQAESG